MGKAAVVLLLAVVTAACAARTPAAVRVAQAKADALVREGCYDCLLDARALYAAIPPARRASVLLPMLEVELLLVLREKELALDPEATLARARAIAAELDATVDVERYLGLVVAIPPDAAGRRLMPATRTSREQLETALTEIDASPFSAPFKSYLKLSVGCGRLPRDTIGPVQESGVPLLEYRLATCDGPIDVAPLRAARTAVPRFVETSLYLGRAAMGSLFGSDGREAGALLEEAYARFPESPAIAFNLGTVHQATGDCRRAAELFSRALALRSDHVDARLGRAVCRTYLSMPEGAIADATVLIDAEAYNRAEAYYWRAWNRRGLKQLDLARTDIEASRALLYNARVLTLAGMIEHDLGDFAKAKDSLTRARDIDSRECQARWYLGLVGFSTEDWDASAAAFADAADCYAMLVADGESQRAAMAVREGISEEFRARQLAGFDAAIAEDRSQKSAADLNAAINYARAQNVAQATVYMKRAAEDPERRTAVEDLRQVLGVPRW